MTRNTNMIADFHFTRAGRCVAVQELRGAGNLYVESLARFCLNDYVILPNTFHCARQTLFGAFGKKTASGKYSYQQRNCLKTSSLLVLHLEILLFPWNQTCK